MTPGDAWDPLLVPVAVMRLYDPGADSIDQIEAGSKLNKLGKKQAFVPATWATLREAIDTTWDCDAMLACYGPEHAGTRPYFHRMSKHVYGALREAGLPLVSRVIGADLDSVGHKPWTRETLDAFSDAMLVAMARDSIAGEWTVFYTTRAGARLLYVLREPMEPPQAEAVGRAVLARLASAGLAPYVDIKVSDWTRLFRLPRVMRDTGQTDLSEFFDLAVQHKSLDGRSIAPIIAPEERTYAPLIHIPRGSRKDPEEAKDLLMTLSSDGSRAVRTEWYKRAVKRLVNRECLDAIKGEARIEDSKLGRNNRLTELVGQSVGMLYNVIGSSPDLIYALWLECVEGLEARTGNDDGRSWTDILWHLVCSCWEKEDAQQRAKKEEVAQERVRSGKLSELVLESVRKWCTGVPELLEDDSAAMSWLSSHLIAHDGRGDFYAMTTDGVYDAHPTSIATLPARIRELGMDTLIPIEETVVVNGAPVVRPIPVQTIITRHGTRIASFEGAVGAGGTVRNIGTDHATLLFRLYARRTDLIPAFDQEADLWLQAMFGEHYLAAVNWIGHALAFDEGPICALSVDGPRSAGKGLLVQGLAECITSQVAASGKEMGRFQSELLCTPFLNIDEGLPHAFREGAQDPADWFRSMTSGMPIKIEQKGRGIITVRNPLRIIFTANNQDVIESLYRNRDLSPEDRAALGIRLLHFKIGDGGAKWLAERGGAKYVNRQGRVWVRGFTPRSDYVLARHFLWIYHHRLPPPAGARLLVEGSVDDSIVQGMAVGAGSAPDVIETVLSALGQATPVAGIARVDDEIYATAQGVVEHYRLLARSRPGAIRLTQRTAGSVLRGLSVRGWPAQQCRPRPDLPFVRWWKLDQEILYRHAITHGHPCDELTGLVNSTPNGNT